MIIKQIGVFVPLNFLLARIGELRHLKLQLAMTLQWIIILTYSCFPKAWPICLPCKHVVKCPAFTYIFSGAFYSRTAADWRKRKGLNGQESSRSWNFKSLAIFCHKLRARGRHFQIKFLVFHYTGVEIFNPFWLWRSMFLNILGMEPILLK